MNLTTDFERQRELLLSGDYYNLFNNLKLNLPLRFFEYANPKNMDGIFNNMFNELNAARTRTKNTDAWCFNDVIKIIAPTRQIEDFGTTIDFLKNKCGIEEKHIKIQTHLANGTLFPNKHIFLSCYAMILLCNRLLKDNDSFKNDISSPLFVQFKKAPSSGFIQEMRAAFAGYFFAFNGSDLEDITKSVWNWVRGIRLKNSYDDAMKELSFVLRNFMGAKFDYHKFEEFKQNYIFDVLFSNNFIDKYESFLKSCGYQIQSDKKDQIKWRHGKNSAPKYPGAFFAPHIEFLLTWSVQALCEFSNSEFPKYSGKNKIKSLETLTKKFFTAVRDGYNDANINIKSIPVFVNQHSSDARKSSKEIKYGKGKKITNKLTGDESKESPGALEFFKKNHLFSFDEDWCLDVRNQKEKELLSLHNKFKDAPSQELAEKIFRIEKDIRQENESIYNGINLDVFVSVPEVLTPNGEFIPRQKAGNIEYTGKIITEKPDIKISSSSVKFQYDLFTDLSPESIFKDLHITRHTNEIFHRFNSNGNGWAHDDRGIYECINEFIQEHPGDLWKTQKNEISKTGRTRLNCKLKYMMFEWDHLPLITQWQKVQENISVICQAVYSGNKSIHIKIAAADEAKTLEEYDWLREHILIKLGFMDSDPNVKDNSRTSRFPGAINPATNRIQKLLHYDPDARFIENWRPLFVTEKNKKAAIKTSFSVRYDKNDKLKDYWVKRIEEVRGGLEEGNQTETLKSIINTASCNVLSIEEFESLLKDYLTKDHYRDIAGLYKYRRQRM